MQGPIPPSFVTRHVRQLAGHTHAMAELLMKCSTHVSVATLAVVAVVVVDETNEKEEEVEDEEEEGEEEEVEGRMVIPPMGQALVHDHPNTPTPISGQSEQSRHVLSSEQNCDILQCRSYWRNRGSKGVRVNQA